MALVPVSSSNKFRIWRERTNEIIDRLNTLGSSSEVYISGGTIDGAVIGGSDPAAGSFTQISLDTPLAIADGGTGQSTAADAINALLPSQTLQSGKVLSTNGTVASWQNFSVAAGDLTGQVAIGNGGTGASTAPGARINLGLEIGVDVQEQNSILQSIAELVLADSNGSDNKFIYFLGVDSNGLPIARTDIVTQFSRVLLASENADEAVDVLLPAQTGNSGKFLQTDGTNVSWETASLILSDNLQAISDLVLADSNGTDDKFIYFLGVDSNGAPIARSDIVTAFARSLLNDPSQSAMRTTLGLVPGVDVQAYDAELAALAGLVSAADSLPYFTGSGTAALTTLSSFGRSLIDDTSEAAARETLGVSIGSDVQAFSDILESISGLSLADSNGSDDKFIYFLGVDSNGVPIARSDIVTQFARTLLNDPSQSAMRTTLGLVPGVDVQVYDAELAAIAGLTSGADLLPYFTGSGTAGTTTITSYARSLIDDANAADARTTLGLVIGTHVQAYDAELAALAGLSSGADLLPYFTGVGAAATTGLSSFMRTVLDDANQATAQATLGLVPGTNVQAYDAELAAIAGLSSSANTFPYFTGSGTAALANITVYSRMLLDDADADEARTTLGLVPGSDYYITPPGLNILDSNGEVNDKIVYYDGVDSNLSPIPWVTTLSPFVRTLLDEVDANAFTTALGIGTIGTIAQYDADAVNTAVGIYVSSANPALRVSQAGAGYAFMVEDNDSDLSPFVISGTGDVGIGTETLLHKFNLLGNSWFKGKAMVGDSIDHANIASIVNTGSSSGSTAYRPLNLVDTSALMKIARVGGNPGVELQQWDSGITTLEGFWDMYLSGDNFAIRRRTSGNTINFFIETDGDIGMGTTTPAAKLDVVGNLIMTGLALVRGTSSDGGAIRLFEDTDNGTSYVSLKSPAALAGNLTWVLPDVEGSANAVLSTNGSGTLQWFSAQAADAELTALAGLTSAADKLPYFTGSGTAAVTDFTSTARDLLDDTSTSVMRTTLGLGTAAVADTGTTDGNVPVYASGAINMADKTLQRPILLDVGEVAQTVAAAATTSIDITAGNVVTLTQDTNITTFNFNNPTATGNLCALLIRRVKDNSGTTRSIVWPTSVDWAGGVAPTLTQTANAVDRFIFTTTDGGTTWYGDALGAAYA